MINNLLIANRGEIARRIARTCIKEGIDYTAVFSDADRDADFLEGAQNAICIGSGPAQNSYMSIDAILDAALKYGCDAIHPGYGFLSENVEFASKVDQVGLNFIGPRPETIDLLGNKAKARQVMKQVGIPVLPGGKDASDDPDCIQKAIIDIGFPAIAKPVFGGGGQGMKVIHSNQDLYESIRQTIEFAQKTFGDGRLMVEKYIEHSRHIEVQIFGDQFGNIVHLFERECSIQRRHQKIIEEAPCITLPNKLRRKIQDAAVLGAKTVKYLNAGTFEFLVTQDHHFYFIEANTRLQVEHPITEEITGIDMVQWQLKIASGRPLPIQQDQIISHGHAVECRIYAEDPVKDFSPCPGVALHVEWPDNLRVDAAFDNHGLVPTFYDPMVAKIIARGSDRATALALLQSGLIETSVLGLTTNIAFLKELLKDPRIIKGNINTHLVDHFINSQPKQNLNEAAVACAAAIELSKYQQGQTLSPWHGTVGPLDRFGMGCSDPLGEFDLILEDEPIKVRLLKTEKNRVTMSILNKIFCIKISHHHNNKYTFYKGAVNNIVWSGLKSGNTYELIISGRRMVVSSQENSVEQKKRSNNILTSPVPGIVSKILLNTGELVSAGDTIAIVEAMKMENRICSSMAGFVKEIMCEQSEIVKAGQVVAVLEPATV